MSSLRVTSLRGRSGNESPSLPDGAVITGVATAGTVQVGSATTIHTTGIDLGSGNINSHNINSTGIVTAINGFDGNITGVAATFTGNVSIAGTLTYEDVTNVDSVGIVTARAGVRVLGAGVTVAGIATFHNGVEFNDILIENVNITAGKLSDNTNINIENGMVHLFTTTETTTSTPNIRFNGSTALNAKMSIGDTISVILITTAAAAAYSANITIDGSAVTERWNGGSAPTEGGASGNDVYNFQIIKTADATYTVLGNVSNFA